jgi:hypothetical protein
MFISLFKIKTFDYIIEYFNALFCYDIVLNIHFYRLSYVHELDPDTYRSLDHKYKLHLLSS